MSMLLNLMRECKNFFVRGCETNTFTIANGQLTLQGAYLKGMYIGITGSFFNDGVYQVGDGLLVAGLTDETFTGTIYKLAIPKDFIALSAEIEAYKSKMAGSPITSESFGNYSYSKAQGKNGTITWQEQFSDNLTPYKKMFTEVWI